MTRAEKVAEAQRLRGEGVTYSKIAERLGVARSTVYRWCNPEYNQRHLEASRAWKDRNRERKRAADRLYDATHKGTCSECGGPTTRESDGRVCRVCLDARAEERARQIEKWWNEGVECKEIARRLGWSEASGVGVEIDRLRKQGYDVPHRYAVGEAYDLRAKLVEAWWAEGLTTAEIGRRLGWNQKTTSNHIAMLRQKGYDLPYRRPQQVAA